MSMESPSKKIELPLDEVMLAMDVVDTLRHRQDLVARELDEDKREALLIDKLRAVYHQQGIEVPDHILAEGVSALAESRFAYEAPKGGFKIFLARLYVSRRVWGKWFVGVLVAALVLILAYSFAYVPYQQAQENAARIELSQTMPQHMDQLYQSVYEETKVQKAVTEAAAMRDRGKRAAAEGDRAGAEQATAALQALLDTLRQSYTLRIVNAPGEKSGFWTFPEINTDATNYYVVVEAIDETTKEPLSLPIENEETGKRETVSKWGVRVPEVVYRSVEADKRDDGLIERNIVGVKQYGFLDVDYVVPVLGGTVTKW